MPEPHSGKATGVRHRDRMRRGSGHGSDPASERARHAALNRFTYRGGFDGYEGRMTCPPSWHATPLREGDGRGERAPARD